MRIGQRGTATKSQVISDLVGRLKPGVVSPVGNRGQVLIFHVSVSLQMVDKPALGRQ